MSAALKDAKTKYCLAKAEFAAAKARWGEAKVALDHTYSLVGLARSQWNAGPPSDELALLNYEATEIDARKGEDLLALARVEFTAARKVMAKAESEWMKAKHALLAAEIAQKGGTHE